MFRQGHLRPATGRLPSVDMYGQVYVSINHVQPGTSKLLSYQMSDKLGCVLINHCTSYTIIIYIKGFVRLLI